MNNAINKINQGITAYLNGKGLTSQVLGLSEAINYDSGETVVPGVVSASGEVYASLFDDRYHVGLYHKLNSKAYSENADNGYGSSNGVEETDDMSLICYGYRNKIDGYELENKIADIIRSVSLADRSERTTCQVSSSLFNRQQVFSAEYSGVPMFLQPNVFIFRVTYKILTARRTCN